VQLNIINEKNRKKPTGMRNKKAVPESINAELWLPVI